MLCGGSEGYPGMFGGSGGGAVKVAPIKRKLPCSFEELYKGSTNKMKISREITDASGDSVRYHEHEDIWARQSESSSRGSVGQRLSCWLPVSLPRCHGICGAHGQGDGCADAWETSALISMSRQDRCYSKGS